MSATSEKPVWLMLTQHWLSLVGGGLLATALISWLFVLPLQIRGHVANPYLGIVVFLVLPAIFFTGLILVPIGIYLSKRQIREGLAEGVVDRKKALQRLAWFFGITTFLNVLIGTQITYQAVEHNGDATILRSDLPYDGSGVCRLTEFPSFEGGMRGVSCSTRRSRLDQQQDERNSSAL